MRPRLPTAGQALSRVCAVVALGLSVWAFAIVGRTSLTLTQTRSLLAMTTRGATTGRLAADRLAAQAQADAARVMAVQDTATREAARAPSGFGLAPTGGYAQRSSSEGEGGSSGATPMTYGPAPYAGAPYGSAPYAPPSYGVAPTSPPSAASGDNVMGYTLPQTTPR